MKPLFQTMALLMLTWVTSLVQANEPVWDGNTVELQAMKLGQGVYAFHDQNAAEYQPKGLPLATSGGFVVGDNGVLLIDTMLNERLFKQVTQLIKAVTDQPILYAVNTSYHGDHSYGNMYLPTSTIIIQHEATQAYIAEHFVKDTDFMISNFGQGRGIEQIKPVAADITLAPGGSVQLNLGNKTVQIMDMGFAQTGGDLFVWEPSTKSLWTGNPIIAVKPTVPWLLDGHLLDTLNTLNQVNDFLPDDAKVIPGHGSVMSKADLRWHLDYLLAVKQGVEQAIDDGLTLEETVARVKLSSFRGYALFDWVHPKLNVPAAYRDLQKANNTP